MPFRDQVLELFSANWRCNSGKDSFVQLGQNKITLRRGYNLLGLKDNKLSMISTFDTYVNSFTSVIQKNIYKLYKQKEYDFLMLITHDDATAKTNGSTLQESLFYLELQTLKDLQFRGSYILLYDLLRDCILYENTSNSFPLHEWFSLDYNKLTNLGPPVYLIVYNYLYYTKNSVKQLEKYTKNIHIIDNKSTYPKLLEYYENEYEYFLDLQPANYGHHVWATQMYWTFPQYFAISDPDLEYNIDLPITFLNDFKDLSVKYKKGKVGFALDISEPELLLENKNYYCGVGIHEWESRFWLNKIENPDYELYDNQIDTTFSLINKQYIELNKPLDEINSGIRVAGKYTCKHLPWYTGWQDKLEPDELEYYRMNNRISTVLNSTVHERNRKKAETMKKYEKLDNIAKELDTLSQESDNELKRDLEKANRILGKVLDEYYRMANE